MFERLGNKKRFDILGRKTKGEVRSVNKLRSAAVDKRKSTLLVEYRQLRKSNAFIDRRFGEDDETLTNDERNLLRFQKQRLREMAGSKFALQDDEPGGQEDQLTHLGRSLADMEDIGAGWSSDDDANGQLDDQLTRDLHFGGGFEPSKRTRDLGDQDGDAEPMRKTKKEVMEEIIAKSKMHKALKSQQKEEDVAETEALDEAWKALAQGGSLAGLMRPKGSKGGDVKGLPIDESDRKFDVLTRELIFEAKAQPGERTLTAEELAELERHRLEELEKQRLKRQRGDVGLGGDDLDDDFVGGSGDEDEAAMPQGGYAARRAKRAKKQAKRAKHGGSDSGDDSGDESGSEGDSEGGSSDEDEDEDEATALEQRRKDRAAGDHPLQGAFRSIAAKLLEKHGLVVPDDFGEEESDEVSSEDEESEEEGTSAEEEESEEDDEGAKPLSTAAAARDGFKPQTKSAKPVASNGLAKVPVAAGAMSFTPALPDSYSDFAAVAEDLSAEDLGELLRRIRGFNATALSTEGRKKTQVLYGCVVQHYVSLAGAVPLSLPHLDALLPHILDLTPQVPFYAATLGRTRLQRAHQQMTQRLKDPVLRATAWPAPKTLLLLKLLTTVYPVSDKRHPVLTPASLLTCAALELCPLARPRDIASGLFLAGLGVHMHAPAQRLCPEPLNFAVNLLRTTSKGISTAPVEEGPRWLALSPNEASQAPTTPDAIPELSVQKVFGKEDDSELANYLSSAEFKSSAAAAAVRLIGRIAASLASIDALPEIMAPAIEVMRQVVAAGTGPGAANGIAHGSGKKKSKEEKRKKEAASGSVAPGVAVLAGRVLAEVEAAVASAQSRRRPLSNATLLAVPEAKQYNPRYEEQFATGKDYDPDRERSDRRRLQRELRREERGAARELRRDGAFMAGVRDKEKAALQADLETTARRAKAFLQQQAHDAKSGGQGGHWKNKRKK